MSTSYGSRDYGRFDELAEVVKGAKFIDGVKEKPAA